VRLIEGAWVSIFEKYWQQVSYSKARVIYGARVIRGNAVYLIPGSNEVDHWNLIPMFSLSQRSEVPGSSAQPDRHCGEELHLPLHSLPLVSEIPLPNFCGYWLVTYSSFLYQVPGSLLLCSFGYFGSSVPLLCLLLLLYCEWPLPVHFKVIYSTMLDMNIWETLPTLD